VKTLRGMTALGILRLVATIRFRFCTPAKPRSAPGLGFAGPRLCNLPIVIVIVTPSQVESRFDDLGGAVLPGSPADFGKLIADEIEKWGKVIRAANIKAE
jgi:hypothetical protein